MNGKSHTLPLCLAISVALLIACTASSATANTWCAQLTNSNRLPDGEEYIAVTMSYIYNGARRGVRMTVRENEDVLSPRKYFGIRRFGFNTTVEKPAVNLKMKVPREWARRFKRYNYGSFGWFEMNISRRAYTLGKGYDRVTPLVIDIYHRTRDLSYTDFAEANTKGQFYAARIANLTCNGTYYTGAFFSAQEQPSACSGPTSTTTTVKPWTTTTVKPTTTTTVKDTGTSTTSSKVTTTLPPVTTSSIPATTSGPTTTSSVPSVTSTTVPPATTSSTLSTTTSFPSACRGEIYRGGICEFALPIDDPAYNRPGRRGLALTCEDSLDFCICTDCINLDPACLTWTVDPAESYLSISKNPDGSAHLRVGESCGQLEAIRNYTVTVTDSCHGWSDRVEVELGKVTIDVDDVNAAPGSESFEVPVSLVNHNNLVRALSVDICECEGGDDRMTCSGCVVDPDRALGFNCIASEMADGCCRVVFYSTDPGVLVLEGSGPVFKVIYGNAETTSDACICLRPANMQVSDRFNEQLCACQSPGEVCFRSCGDVYPPDCIGENCGPQTTCGDKAVNLFDILEAVDIILGNKTATPCQIDHGDVPNGKPPYCGSPAGTLNCGSDGEIDVLDVLVIIDMAQGRANCCDYCLFKRIF